MNYKNNISEAVKEQLGIEEDEDPLEVAPIYVSEEIVDLKNQLKERDHYIHNLETVVNDLQSRIGQLEKLFFEFKRQKR